MELEFHAVAEARPGPKWRARFARSWPAYRAWLEGRGGAGPSLDACAAALDRHMPELVPVWRRLCRLAGDDPQAARLLSMWCPPPYLVSCAQAALPGAGLLVRNYDLSPELNEGLVLRTEWTGRPVVAMTEFLWGVSDGINADGLAVSLAFGGSRETGTGFGIPLILRYVLETCATVAGAVSVLRRVPSHMAYNVTLLDRGGAAATVEVGPGGRARLVAARHATNHQGTPSWPDHARFTRTVERHDHISALLDAPGTTGTRLVSAFLQAPLYGTRYAEGFGTLFTAAYDVRAGSLTLHWPGAAWRLGIDGFAEGARRVGYGTSGARVSGPAPAEPAPWPAAAAGDGAEWEAIAARWIAYAARFVTPG